MAAVTLRENTLYLYLGTDGVAMCKPTHSIRGKRSPQGRYQRIPFTVMFWEHVVFPGNNSL